MNFIDEFLDQYQRMYDYYLAVARLCQQRCEALLAQKGIRAIVTSRAKKYERLEQKVRQRAPKKKENNEARYTCISDIYDDIVDLAGVRIALYFPKNADEVDELIKSEFTLKEEPIIFPEIDPEKLKKKKVPYEKRFTGYGARYYRVYLKKETIGDPRYSQSCIEIQVASVLMHAWAEVEHDLLYKPLSGELSLSEYAILDEINGLVLTGEIALERLQNAQEVRLGKDGTQFIDQYELSIFLHNHFRNRGIQNPNMIIGHADVLFRFLQLTGLNYPEKLRAYTAKLNSGNENQTIYISDQLLDIILGTDEELYKTYKQALFEVSARSEKSSTENALANFLTHWINLERTLRTLMVKKDFIKSYTSGGLSNEAIRKALSYFLPEDYGIFEEFLWLRHLRNEVVHGAAIPDVDTLNKAVKVLTDFHDKLSRSNLEDEPGSDSESAVTL